MASSSLWSPRRPGSEGAPVSSHFAMLRSMKRNSPVVVPGMMGIVILLPALLSRKLTGTDGITIGNLGTSASVCGFRCTARISTCTFASCVVAS